MSSPVFDDGIAKKIAGKVLNSLLFGICISDDRNFSTKSHILASIVNIISAIIYIGITFSKIFYAQLVVAFIVPIFYFSMSFIAKEREAQKISMKLSFKDEFSNALMSQVQPIFIKIVNLALNISSFVLFSCFTNFFQLPAYSSIFFTQLIVPSLRGIDTQVAKFTPVNELEPCITTFFYTAAWCPISIASPLVGAIFIIVTPFLLFIGIFPQFQAAILFIFEFITRVVGMQAIVPSAFYIGTAVLVSIFSYSQILPIGIVFISICSNGWNRSSLLQNIILLVSSLVLIVVSLILKFLDIKIPQFCLHQSIQTILDIKYLSLIIGGAFSLLILPLTFLSRIENSRQNNGKFAIVIGVFSIILSVITSVLVFVEYINSFCLQKSYFENIVLMIIFTRSIVNGLFDPLGNICGMLLGGWLPFIIKGYSFFGLSIAGGSWIFYSINRLIQSFKYLQVQSQLCFKEPRIGWQLKMYKFRYLLYCYNCIIFLVCSFLDFPSLPIGGTPLFIIFHPHHIAFFNQRCQYKDCRQFNPDIVSSLQDDSVDKQDDIQLYNSTVSSLFGKQNTKFQQQLRKINFQEGYMPQGTIQVLMSEKKMIFLLNTGSDILRIRHNYLVYALETKETSCHTLERTCLERYVDFIKDKSKANVTNVVGVASTVLSSSVCYTDPIPQVLDPPRRQFGITLGQQNVEQKHVPKTSENRVPQNAPLFTNRWLVKYKGTISTEDFSTNDYSLSGVFTSEFYREELIRIFVGLLYISLTQLDQKIIQALSMLYQQLSQSSSGQFENIEESLRYFFGMNLSPKISNAVTGLCYYSNFTYTNIDADTDIPNLYQSIQYIIKNDIDRQLQQEMQKVILSCFRNAVYYSQQQILMGDDFAQSYVELAEINDDQKDILFSHPNEPQWNHALKSQKYTKIYAVMAGPRVLEYSFQHVSWDVFHLPNYFYKMIWSSIQTDLLVFDATDDERFSVQSLPAALRNLFCEAAGSPFGYPLVEYGQGII